MTSPIASHHLPKISKTCAKCAQSMPGTVTMALGMLWHQDCFTCKVCSKPIKDEFHDVSDEIYCKACYAVKFNPKCGACEQVLQDMCLKAMGKHWHQDCFVCKECKKPFLDCFYYAVEGVPYCLDDHWGRRLAILKEKKAKQHQASALGVGGCGGIPPAESPLPAAATTATPPSTPNNNASPTDSPSPSTQTVPPSTGQSPEAPGAGGTSLPARKNGIIVNPDDPHTNKEIRSSVINL